MNLSRVQCSLVLSNEISNVATALRQTTRWENEYDEPLEDTLHGEFVSLQQKVLYMRQWEVVDPFEYVAPFLDVVRSEHVGADITSTALAALWKLLTANVVPASHHNSAQTLKHVVAALDGCKFTKASNATYENVVTRLVQVFAACVCAEVGVLLNADDVTLVTMSIWKWCEYSPTNESVMRTSSIFLQTVRQCLQQLISCLFSRLRTCQVFPDEIPVPTEYAEQTLDYVGLRSDAVYQPPGVSFHLTEESMAANHLCCGLEPFHEILIYCTEPMLVESDTEAHTDRILFVLQMLHTAIVHAGEILAGYESLLTVIRGHVFPALTFCLHRMSQRIHASVFQVVFAMYKLFGDELLLQIECFFQTSVLRLCEGRGCPTQEHQEIALEALVDFCGYPGFLRDIYLNLDCRIERSNLFEDICSLLSKTAFPVKTPLYSIHMISMEGLLAMLLTLSSACGGDESPVDLPEPKSELPCYVDVWTELFRGVSPEFAEVEGLLDGVESEDMKHVMIISLEKRLKQRIAVAVDHFNRDFKKGFQYLRSIHLFPEKNNADVIAKFLRVCPNLNGHVMGDMLGDCDAFYQEILECFTETFDFSGKTIDAALRMYFDVFKVPGEAQKVDRVLSKFSKVFFDFQDGTFKSEDSVHILAYSIIMLNTDLHKPEIKNKMTPDQFIRNNRGMNGDEDFPRKMLEDIYQSIKEQPMRISDGSNLDFSPVRWMNLNQVSKTPRGKKENPLRLTSALDRDMFALIWGPAVAAISVILDQANELTTVQTTLTGLKLAAKIAFFHGVDEVIDSLVVSLFKSTQMLSPRTPKALVQFGLKEEAQLATESAFFIANKYTSSLGSSGWQSVMDCVIRLSQLEILPPHFWEDENEADGFSEPMFEMSAENSSSTGGSSVSATLWPFRKTDSPLSEEEQAAQQRALSCIRRCEIRVVFRDTKFLKIESLIELIKAICFASQSDEKTARICLDLVFYITLRNRDRIQHVWPEIEAHLEKILNTEPKLPSSIIEAAVFGILRVCQRSLAKNGLSGVMLRILQMVPNVGEEIIERIAERLSEEIHILIKLAAPVIEEGWAWEAICHLLCLSATSRKNILSGVDTLAIIAKNGEHISSENFLTVMETLRYFQQQSSADTVCMIVDLIHDMVSCLTTWPLPSSGGEQLDSEIESAAAQRGILWYGAFVQLKNSAMEMDTQVRNHAVLALQRCVVLGEALKLPMETWKKTLKKDMMDFVQFLTKKQNSRDFAECDKTLRQALRILTKTFLQFLDALRGDADFAQTWMKILFLLQQSYSGREDELSDAVPEETKNLILVMHKEGILIEGWVDEHGMSMWDMTWRKARDISFALKPEMLLNL